MTDRTQSSRLVEPDEYEHLMPLFAEMEGLDVDDPRHAEIRDRLITGYLPLAEYLVQRHSLTGITDERLFQAASVSLIHAIDRFDPRLGADFLSFAIPTISGEVRRRFRDATWPSRSPAPFRNAPSALGAARAALARRLGRLPTDEELAEHLGIIEPDTGRDAERAQRIVAYDDPAPGTQQTLD